MPETGLRMQVVVDAIEVRNGRLGYGAAALALPRVAVSPGGGPVTAA